MDAATCAVKKQVSGANSGLCAVCGKEGKIFLPYGPVHYCETHFLRRVERRVKDTVRRFTLLKEGERVVVGVSGGKDSLATLYLLNKYYARHVELHALLIDEGIPGYRDKAIETGVRYCKEWDIPYTVRTYEEDLGIEMQQVHAHMLEKKENAAPCSYCGVFRRRVLNQGARELGADKLATGHNLDDEAQSILMNVFDNNVPAFQRLGPLTAYAASAGFVPRIKPLYEVPEQEIVYYTSFKGIEHYSHDCCPLSAPAKRNAFRSMLNKFERQYPGTKKSILRFLLGMKESSAEQAETQAAALIPCSFCGAPCAKSPCPVCARIARVTGKGAI